MKKGFEILLIVLPLLFVSGCINQQFFLPGREGDINMSLQEGNESVVIARIAFPVDEYSRLAKFGEGTVKGSIYLQNPDGKKIIGRQTRLYLNPVTSYSRQWYEESYMGGYKMGKADPRLFNYLKFTSSDKNGNFAFYGIPGGRYYVIGVVRCGIECNYDPPRNIRVAKEISLHGSETVTVDLSKVY